MRKEPSVPLRKPERITFSIADIAISLSLPGPASRVSISPTFRRFIAPHSRRPDISIRTVFGQVPRPVLSSKAFLAGVRDWWALYRESGKYYFVLYPVTGRERTFSITHKKVIKQGGASSYLELKRSHDFSAIKTLLPLPRRLAVFDKDLRKGTVYVETPTRSRLLPNPLEYPLLDLLLAELLAVRNGIKLHACGVVDRGRCYLFLGHPRKGKSTMARLWRKKGLVMNDDRVPVRRTGKGFIAFPAPGYGVHPASLSGGVPVHKIFFLDHGKKNSVRKHTGTEALNRILNTTPVATWDADKVKKAVKFFVELSRTVPCYSLRFTPDAKVVDFVRGVR